MSESSAPALLSARGLAWRAGPRTLLGPLDLDVHAGECLMVVGPNGAGKTTLLRLLTGLLSPAAGEIRYRGRPFSGLSRRERARHLAYVPQVRPSSVPLSVFEVVLLGRYPHLQALQLAPRAEDFAAVESALSVVGIGNLRERPLDELSGGERQAVYIAAALAQEAEMLVLDEPTTHLDARHQRDAAALLLKLKRESGRTVVAATHDLNLASLLGDRLLALAGGRVLAVGTPAEILRPEVLAELFDTEFEIVRAGERPVTLLQLAP
ncbi:MAG TPA: ABC transporter ATP-binding protein [Thermoanaerobaculia bacterium]|nr:ABC transporter ATP-binding protein [Thermoanaerobaculia bacterium]